MDIRTGLPFKKEDLATPQGVYDVLGRLVDRLDDILTLHQMPRWLGIDVDLLQTMDGASAPGISQVTDDGAGSVGVFARAFDAATIEYVHFGIRIPKWYKAKTNLVAYLDWAPSDATAGNVRWTLEYVRLADTVAIGTTSSFTSTVAAPGAVSMLSTAIGTISGDYVEDDLIQCRLARDASDVADTYAADAWAMNLSFRTITEKHGTRVI